MTALLAWMDAYYDWWIAFWSDHPVLFAVMLAAGLALAWYRRKP